MYKRQGLSYTEFEFGKLKLSKKNIKKGDVLKVTTSVKNIGKRAGSIGVDCFVRDCYASVTPAVKRLKRYISVELAKGEERKIVFELNEKDLSFTGQDGKRIVEAGDFEVMIGGMVGKFKWVG